MSASRRLVPTFIAALGLMACGSPAAVEPGRQAPLVGPDVYEALERDGEVRVMVALRPASVGVAGGDAGSAGLPPHAAGLVPATRLEARMAQVADLARGVLDRVDGLDVARRFGAVPALAVTIRDTATLARLADDGAVVRVDLDVGGTGALARSVPKVGADRRHARGNDGAGAVVAILDTGVDTDHPSLAGRIIHEACFSQNGHCHNGASEDVSPGSAQDDAGHGTHVAGIMVSDGTVGAPGMAPAAELVAIKVMYNCGFSGCFDFFSDIVAALDHLIVHHDSLGTRAVNMSLGTSALYSGACDEAAATHMAGSVAVNTLRELGVLSVASSMNDGSSTQMAAPACFANVISVAAINSQNVIAPSSNTNGYTDLVAPGVGIVSLAIGGGTRSASGTSMAAPHAVGCLALLEQEDPDRSTDDFVARLLASPVEIVDPSNDVHLPALDCRPERDPPDPRSTASVPRPN